MIQNNIIHSAWKIGIKKLIFLGSNCIYPKDALQPFREDALFTGEVEKSNEAYAIAKIAGIKICQFYNKQYNSNFISVVPCSLFGPGDNFDPYESHLIPALIRKFHEAKLANKKEIILWGTGESKREIMHADDAARACIFLMKKKDAPEIVNAGSGIELSIKDVAKIIADVVGFKGEILFEMKKISGIKRKMIDSSVIKSLGWKPEIEIGEGLRRTYGWFKDNYDSLNRAK